MKKVLIGGVGIIVILFIIGAASGGGNKSQKVGENSQPTSQTATTSQTQAATTYKVGDQIQSGEYIVSVNSVRKSSGSGYVKPKEGSVYIIPNVTIQNNSKDKTTISSLLQMYIKDGEGNKYNPALTSDATGKVDGELLAGEKVKGDVGFEIPTTAKDLKFYYNAAWLTGQSITIDLGQ
jgi:hypothetical protein